MTTKLWVFLIVVVFLIGLLGACGGSDKDQEEWERREFEKDNYKRKQP